MRLPSILTLCLLFASPANAQEAEQEGLRGAIRGCEEWVLNPASWADGPATFKSAVGLGNRMGLVAEIDPASLPPVELRRANHYWRINSTMTTGYILVVSDQLPMCHISGGGDVDLQPVVEAVLSSSGFRKNWEQVSAADKDGLTSTLFRSRVDPLFSATVTRPNNPDARRDRVQVLITATYRTSND
jgi:hypothetical protein